MDNRKTRVGEKCQSARLDRQVPLTWMLSGHTLHPMISSMLIRNTIYERVIDGFSADSEDSVPNIVSSTLRSVEI